MKKIYLSSGYLQTKKIGEKFVKESLNKKERQVFIIGLKGDLGGGKTTFLQGLAKGLGIKEKILSPTFVIFKRFKIKDPKFKNFYHFDCYRIKKPKEIFSLNFKKIICDPRNIIAIEWAERIKNLLPKNTVWIEFEFLNKNKRRIIFKNR